MIEDRRKFKSGRCRQKGNVASQVGSMTAQPPKQRPQETVWKIAELALNDAIELHVLIALLKRQTDRANSESCLAVSRSNPTRERTNRSRRPLARSAMSEASSTPASRNSRSVTSALSELCVRTQCSSSTSALLAWIACARALTSAAMLASVPAMSSYLIVRSWWSRLGSSSFEASQTR
jgi:hypothetical protein